MPTLLAATTLLAAPAEPRKPFDVPAGEAIDTLKRAAQQSGREIMYLAGTVRGVVTHPIKGQFTTREALDRMVANTDLRIVQDEKTGALTVTRAAPATPARAPPESPRPSPRNTQSMTIKKNPLAWLGSLLALAFGPAQPSYGASDFPAGAAAHDTGIVTGTVSNLATGAYLEGAEVTLEPGHVSALTTREGKFIFAHVPAGDYRMIASYTGLDAKALPLSVRAGATVINDIGLTAEIYKMSEFVVAGEREGNSLAVRQQENAPNVKNVLSSDAFGNVADFNLGDFLQRVPGFSTEISEGEIVRVQIRGASSDLSSMSVDGTRAANGTPRAFTRGFDVNTIPTEFIETIEVTKAATPDMDADSIGGAVNLKTKSAFDRKGRRINYAYGYSYNWEQKTFRPQGDVGYSDVWLHGKLGVMFTASYNETHQPRNTNGITWQSTTDLSKPAWFNADTVGQDQVKHSRVGLGWRFDYKLSDTTKLYFNTQYSYYADQLNRRWGRLSTLAAANILTPPTELTEETKNQTFTYYQTFRDRDVVTLNYTLGGESEIFGGKLDYNTNYSPSHGGDLGRLFPQRTVAGVGFRETRSSDHKTIFLQQISGPDILDVKNQKFGSFDIPESAGKDRILGAQVNFKRAVPFAFPLSLKAGGRFREQTRERDNTRRLYSYTGTSDNLAALLDTGYDYTPNGPDPKDAGLPIQHQFLNLNALKDELQNHPERFNQDVVTSTRDSITADFKATEQVSAGYLQGDLKLGRLGILGGVRMEATHVDGKGFKREITPAEKARRAAWAGTVTPEENIRRTIAEYSNPTDATGSYHSFFPSVHLKYQLTSNLLARASYSTGVGRPAFTSIIPTETVDNDKRTITANNPSLRPEYSKSYDLSFEYYFRPAGLFSVGVFQKDIRDFQFNQSTTLGTDNPYGSEYDGYLLTTSANGGSARIRGLEVSFQQQFTNLPGIWKSFGAFANMTWQDTRGDYGTPGKVTTQHELANFTPRGGNAGISFIRHPWTIRVKANHTGERLLVYSTDPSQSQYLMKSTPIDINAAYALNRYTSLYFDVVNLFNAGRQYQYKWIPEHRSDTWVYTTFVKVGVRGTF